MEDLVSCLLNINIPVLNNTAKKKLSNCAIKAIKYSSFIKSPILIKSIFFGL